MSTTRQNNIAPILEDLQNAAPMGFALAFHIHFTTPKLLFQSYSDEWMSHYSENGFVMQDPTVLWGFQNEGVCRWSDLADMDQGGVLTTAKDFGLNYGVTCAIEVDGSRSIGSFAHKDHEFSEADCLQLTKAVEDLHKISLSLKSLSVDTVNAVDKLGIRVSQAPG